MAFVLISINPFFNFFSTKCSIILGFISLSTIAKLVKKLLFKDIILNDIKIRFIIFYFNIHLFIASDLNLKITD